MKRILILTLCLLFTIPCWADVEFDGTDDRINLGTDTISPDYNGAGAVSAAVWAKKTADYATDDTGVLFEVFIDGTNGGFSFSVRDSGDTEQIGGGGRPDGGESFQTLYEDIDPSDWFFAVLICDFANDEVSLSINGATMTTQAKSFTGVAWNDGTPTRQDHIGGGHFDTTVSFTQIGFVATWKAVLTQHEVDQLYHAKSKRHVADQIQPSNQISCWTLDDVATGTSADGDTFTDHWSDNDGTGSDGGNNTGMTAYGSLYLSYP